MLPLLLALTATADLPPPVGYVEKCTVENHAAPGRACRSCDAYHGGREACEALEKEGFVQVCKTRGASVWDEVLCKGAATPAEPGPADGGAADAGATKPAVDPAPSKADGSTSKCSHAPLGALAPWLLLLPVPLLRRRRA